MKNFKKDPTDQRRWSEGRTKNFDYISQYLKDEPDRSILLDLGAGECYFEDLFKRFNWISVDRVAYPKVKVVADLMEKLPFEDNYADIIILSNVLEHVPYPDKLLKECYRVLKSNGKILGTAPLLAETHQFPRDFLRYTRQMLEILLKDAGFTQEIGITELEPKVYLFQMPKGTLLKIKKGLKFLKSIILHPNYKTYSIGHGFIAKK